MRNTSHRLVGGLFAAALLTTVLAACTTETTGLPESATGATSGQADIESTGTPRPGDCVGISGATGDGQVWAVNCANRNAVARVTRQVPHGQSVRCTTDDYIGFDFSDDSKPSLCLMLYGAAGDCYRDFTTRMAIGPRVDCSDPTATVRVVAVINGDGRTRCGQITPPTDPNAAALFYGDAPDVTGKTGAVGDVTFCLASPKP